MKLPASVPVVAVTPTGPIKFKNLDAALASVHVTLADPIFSEPLPIDVTYIRGPGLEDWDASRGDDPWAFLWSHATERDEPPAKRR